MPHRNAIRSSLQPHSTLRRAKPSRVGCAFAAVLIGVASLVASPTAGADDVGDLQVKADRIAQQLNDLQAQIGEIGEKFNQSQVRRQELALQKAGLLRRSQAARKEVVARRADAARFAMSAYVGVDQGDALSLALDGRQWDLSRRTGYAAIRVGDREQIIDDLSAAQQANADLLDAVAEANTAERKVAADLESQQREATRLINQQERVQSGVQGELAEAVARRQAALAAQAQRAAAKDANSSSDGAQATETTTGSASTPSGSGGETSSVPSAAGSSNSSNGSSSSGSSGSSGSTTATTKPATTSPAVAAPPVTTPATTTPPVTVTPVTPVATSGRGQTAVIAAISQLGVRYSWGGGTASGPSMGFGPGAGIVGFDCSGLALYAWAKAGVYLPHSAQIQYNMSAKVSLSALQPGDLVFYGTSSTDVSHVAIYVGGGQVIHAPNSRTVVQYGAVNLWGGYYAWIGAGRPG